MGVERRYPAPGFGPETKTFNILPSHRNYENCLVFCISVSALPGTKILAATPSKASRGHLITVNTIHSPPISK